MIYVVGGNNPLNFRVLDGTTQPSNLKENDVWVNTSTAITSWDFSATEPLRRSKNKNLIVYPYESNGSTTNGITFTVYAGGTIGASGTASAQATFYLNSQNPLTLPAGTYTFSGAMDGGGSSTWVVGLKYSYDNFQTHSYSTAGTHNTITFDRPVKVCVYVQVKSGVTVSGNFKPQIEKGSTATSFVKGDATGQVWFSVGTSSTAPFNALKKDNVLAVYPLSAKQYVNGAWVDKTAKTYQSGAWVDWIPAGTLYDKGNQCTHVTGGWYTAASGAGSVTYNATSITVKVTNNNDAYVICSTKNKIDLTNYNTIKVNVTDWSKSANSIPGFCISDSVGTTVHRIANIDITGTGVWSLDVSSFSGEYYVCFWGYWATNWTLTFDKVWME